MYVSQDFSLFFSFRKEKVRVSRTFFLGMLENAKSISGKPDCAVVEDSEPANLTAGIDRVAVCVLLCTVLWAWTRDRRLG